MRSNGIRVISEKMDIIIDILNTVVKLLDNK